MYNKSKEKKSPHAQPHTKAMINLGGKIIKYVSLNGNVYPVSPSLPTSYLFFCVMTEQGREYYVEPGHYFNIAHRIPKESDISKKQLRKALERRSERKGEFLRRHKAWFDRRDAILQNDEYIRRKCSRITNIEGEVFSF